MQEEKTHRGNSVSNPRVLRGEGWRAWQMSQYKKTWLSTAVTQQVTPLTATLSPWWEIPDGPSDGDRCLSIASQKFQPAISSGFFAADWGTLRALRIPEGTVLHRVTSGSSAMTPPHLQCSKWTRALISVGDVKSHQDCLLEHFKYNCTTQMLLFWSPLQQPMPVSPSPHWHYSTLSQDICHIPHPTSTIWAIAFVLAIRFVSYLHQIDPFYIT